MYDPNLDPQIKIQLEKQIRQNFPPQSPGSSQNDNPAFSMANSGCIRFLDAFIYLFAIWGALLIIIFIYGLAFGIAFFKLPAMIAGVIAIFLLGKVLFHFRKIRPWFFGVFEVLSALFLGGFTIAHYLQYKAASFEDFLKGPDVLTVILGLSSSIYIVVRGLDNMDRAKRDSDRTKQIEQLLCSIEAPINVSEDA